MYFAISLVSVVVTCCKQMFLHFRVFMVLLVVSTNELFKCFHSNGSNEVFVCSRHEGGFSLYSCGPSP